MIPPDMIPIMSAIQADDKARARRLLHDLLKINPTAEAWYQASRLTESPEHELKCLKRALALDPYHTESRRRYNALQPARVQPDAAAAISDGRQFAPDVNRPKKLDTDTIPVLIDDDTLPLKRARPRRKKRGAWFYVGILSAALLSLVSSFFVLNFLGSPVPSQILGAITGDQPVTEIDGVPLEEVEDAPSKVEPSITRSLSRADTQSDTLAPGFAHEYEVSASAGEEFAVMVQFLSPTASDVRRNVAMLDPDGRSAGGRCESEALLDGDTGIVLLCRADVSGAWRLRILGRSGESTGLYFVSMENMR